MGDATVLTSLTVDQMKVATEKQITDDVALQIAKLDKKALIETLTGQSSSTVLTESKDQKEGQTLRVEVTNDVLGTKIGSKRTEWTYYPDGPVDEITIINFDAADKETERMVIKHYTDGRQLTVSSNSVGITEEKII